MQVKIINDILQQQLDVATVDIGNNTYSITHVLDTILTDIQHKPNYSVHVDGVIISPDDYNNTYVCNNSNITLFIMPGYGFMTAAWAAVVEYFASGAWMATVAQMAVATMFTLAAQALLRDKPTVSDSANFGANKNYGFGGIQTEYSLGTTYPLVYGRCMTGGKVLSQRLYSNDDDDQALDTLLVLSYGKIRGIRTQADDGVCTSVDDAPWIMVDGNYISNYQDCTWDYRLGDVNQTAIPMFNDASTLYQDNQAILYDDWYTISAAGNNQDFDRAEFNFVFPQGLYTIGYNDGKPRNTTVKIYIRYRQVGSDDWTLTQYEWQSNKTSTFYKSVKLNLPTRAKYDFGIKRVSAISTDDNVRDGVELQSYNRIIQDDFTYPGFALVAIRALATSQLSSTMPNYIIKLDGKYIPYYTTSWQPADTWDTNNTDDGNIARNPGWVIHDLIHNDYYGLGNMYTSNIHVANKCLELASHANYLVDDGSGNMERRHSCDVVIDNISNAKDLIAELCSTYHCSPITAGVSIYPQLDKPRLPVNAFGMGDIITDEQGNSLIIEEWASIEDKPNVINLQYYDITNNMTADIVQYPDDYTILSDAAVRKQSTTVHSITRRSEAIRYARDLYNRNTRNKTIAFATTSAASNLQVGDVIIFAHDIPMFDYSGRVYRTRSNNEIELDNNWPEINTDDHTYKLLIKHNTDTMQTLDVASIDTSGDRIVIHTIGNYNSTPLEGSSAILIEDRTEPVQYIITNLSRDDKLNVNITGLIYDESVYSDITPPHKTKVLSHIPDPNTAPSAPTDLTLDESYASVGIVINCVCPTHESYYDHTVLYVSGDAVNWTDIWRGRTVDNVTYTDILPGSTYYVRAITYNRYNRPCTTPAVASISITGVLLPPDVRGLEIHGQGNNNIFVGADCKFRWRLASDFATFGQVPLGSEATGLGQQHQNYIKDNLVEIIVDGKIVRQEYVVDNTYTYTWTKNVEDNITPRRAFTVRVKYRDNYNQVSANYAVLQVINEPPNMSSGAPILQAQPNAIRIDWTAIASTDYELSKYVVYCDTNNPPTTILDTLSANHTTTHAYALDPDNTYYAKIIPYDVFGVGVGSQVSDGVTPDILPSTYIDYLDQSIAITDSLDTADMSGTYNGDYNSGGIVYGSDSWIEHDMGIEYFISNVAVGSLAGAKVYISYKDTNGDWQYLKANNNHALTDGKLLPASNATDAATNYWLLDVGKNTAMYPYRTISSVMRLHIIDPTTIHELAFNRLLLADDLIVYNASIQDGVINTIQSHDWSSGAGSYIDLQANGSIKLGGSNNPVFDYNGNTKQLALDAEVNITGGSGLSNLTDAKTSSLVDDAGLGNTALWTSISGVPYFGDLAYEDVIEAAKLGTTIISGGYIKSTLLNVNDIISTGNILVVGDADITANNTSADTTNVGGVASSTVAGWVYPDTTSINGGSIHTGTITADQIKANTITSSELTTGAFVTSSANISSGVITSAKISNLAVTTLKLADNAVTIPVSAYTAADVLVSYTDYSNIQQVTITSTGGPIHIMLTCTVRPQYTSGANMAGYAKLLRGTTSLYNSNVFGFTGYWTGSAFTYANLQYSFMIVDTPGVGTYTYYLQWQGGGPSINNQVYCSHRSMILLETKK